MKQRALFLTLLGLLLLTAVALAQSSGYSLSWWTVDGGGGYSEGQDAYTLIGTIGQPDAGAMSGEGYNLYSGFWPGGAVAAAEERHRIYLPVVLRNF